MTHEERIERFWRWLAGGEVPKVAALFKNIERVAPTKIKLTCNQQVSQGNLPQLMLRNFVRDLQKAEYNTRKSEDWRGITAITIDHERLRRKKEEPKEEPVKTFGIVRSGGMICGVASHREEQVLADWIMDLHQRLPTEGYSTSASKPLYNRETDQYETNYKYATSCD